jgi:hypothetical protein
LCVGDITGITDSEDCDRLRYKVYAEIDFTSRDLVRAMRVHQSCPELLLQISSLPMSRYIKGENEKTGKYNNLEIFKIMQRADGAHAYNDDFLNYGEILDNIFGSNSSKFFRKNAFISKTCKAYEAKVKSSFSGGLCVFWAHNLINTAQCF